MKKIYTKKQMYMLKNYKEVRGVLTKKYRTIWGKYIIVIDEDGVKSRISVNEALYTIAELGTKWTIGHIGRNLINSRPGYCKKTDK